MIAAFLGLTDVEWKQARLLARMHLTMLFRGTTVERRGKRRTTSTFSTLLWTNLVIGCFLSFTTGMFLELSAIPALWMATGFFMTGTLIAGDFALSLLEHQDTDIVFHRPLTSRTLYAARLLQLQWMILLVSLGFYSGPAMAGLPLSGWNPFFPLSYLFMGMLQVVFLTFIVLGLYAGLSRAIHIERVKSVAGWINALLAIGMILCYQAQPVVAPIGEAFEQERGALWTYAVPPVWFSAATEMTLLGPRRELILQTLLALAATAVLVAFGSRLLRSGYQEKLLRGLEHKRLGIRAPRLHHLALVRRLLFVHPGMESAGFELVARHRGTAKPWMQSATLAALIVFLAWRGHIHDPFVPSSSLSNIDSSIWQGMLSFVLCVGVTAIVMSPSAPAAWFLTAAPIQRYGSFFNGIKKGVLYLYVPVYIGVGGALSLFWPFTHAFLFILGAWLNGIFLLHLVSFLSHPLPFSEEPQAGAHSIRLLIVTLGGMTMGGLSGILWWFAYAQGASWFLLSVGALLAGTLAASNLSKLWLNFRSPLGRPPE